MTESDRDRQRQAETGRDRQRQAETGRSRGEIQTARDKVRDRDREIHI